MLTGIGFWNSQKTSHPQSPSRLSVSLVPKELSLENASASKRVHGTHAVQSPLHLTYYNFGGKQYSKNTIDEEMNSTSSLFLKSGAFNKFKNDYRRKPSQDHLNAILGNNSSSRANIEKKSVEMRLSQAQFKLPTVRYNSTNRRNQPKFILHPTETNTSYVKRESLDLFSPRKTKATRFSINS